MKEQIIQEGQIVADLAFRAEAELGEFLKALNLRGGRRRGKEDQTSTRESLKSLGITRKQSFYAQKIAAHPDAIDEVLLEAKRNKEIPSKYNLLKRIDQKAFSEREKSINEQFLKMKERNFKFETIIERAIDDVARQIKGKLLFPGISSPFPSKHRWTLKYVQWLKSLSFSSPYLQESLEVLVDL